MRFFRSSSGAPLIESFQPELRVVEHEATRRDATERGPRVRLCAADARIRMLTDGELVWVRGQRGQQLAELTIDDTIAPFTCALRDLPGVVVSESVTVMKPDLDTPTRTTA